MIMIMIMITIMKLFFSDDDEKNKKRRVVVVFVVVFFLWVRDRGPRQSIVLVRLSGAIVAMTSSSISLRINKVNAIVILK